MLYFSCKIFAVHGKWWFFRWIYGKLQPFSSLKHLWEGKNETSWKKCSLSYRKWRNRKNSMTSTWDRICIRHNKTLVWWYTFFLQECVSMFTLRFFKMETVIWRLTNVKFSSSLPEVYCCQKRKFCILWVHSDKTMIGRSLQ